MFYCNTIVLIQLFIQFYSKTLLNVQFLEVKKEQGKPGSHFMFFVYILMFHPMSLNSFSLHYFSVMCVTIMV